MTHIDEHMLEIYVLSPKEVGGEVARIEEHLQECAGCLDLVDSMRSLYADARSSVRDIAPQPEVSRALIRHSQKIAFPTDRPGYAPRYVPARMQKASQFVRTHPIVASVGGIGTIGALLFLLNFGVNNYLADRNPSYVHYDTTRDLVEVLNKESEVLWTLQTWGTPGYVADEGDLVHHTVIADLDGDYRTEVITSIRLWDPSSQTWAYGLAAYAGEGKLRFQKRFSEVISYHSRVYPANYAADGILALGVRGGKDLDVFFSVKNYRSPYYLERLDPEGNILGRYWHFGHLHGPFSVSRNDSAHAAIVLCGINDAADSIDGSFPAIVVLEPSKVRGTVESSTTRGFGYATSQAERFYIRLPSTDIGKALHTGEGALYLNEDDHGLVSIFEFTSLDSGARVSLEWVFSNEWKLLAVKPTSQFLQTRARLVDEHKVAGNLDAGYLDRMMKKVRYWDGEAWSPEWKTVNH
jgi:hypothetical protein